MHMLCAYSVCVINNNPLCVRVRPAWLLLVCILGYSWILNTWLCVYEMHYAYDLIPSWFLSVFGIVVWNPWREVKTVVTFQAQCQYSCRAPMHTIVWYTYKVFKMQDTADVWIGGSGDDGPHEHTSYPCISKPSEIILDHDRHTLKTWRFMHTLYVHRAFIQGYYSIRQ